MNSQVLDNILVVNLTISLWSGIRKLTIKDLGISADRLPPRELASLGAIKLIDPDDLKPTAKLKKRAQRACESAAVRFIGGYAVPKHRGVDLDTDLNAIRDEFSKEVHDLLAKYDDRRDQFAKRYPAYAAIIAEKAPTRAYLAHQYRFDFQIFQVSASTDAPPDGLNQQVTGLADQLALELAATAETILDASFVGKDSLHQRSLSPIRQLLQKLSGLAFLDRGIAQIGQQLTDCLVSMPKTGPIIGPDMASLFSILQVMAQPSRLRKHALGIASMSSFPTMPIAKPPAPIVSKPTPVATPQAKPERGTVPAARQPVAFV